MTPPHLFVQGRVADVGSRIEPTLTDADDPSPNIQVALHGCREERGSRPMDQAGNADGDGGRGGEGVSTEPARCPPHRPPDPRHRGCACRRTPTAITQTTG